MKFNMRNQTTLKMLLLLALVANVTYEPLSRQFKSMDLSTVTDEVAGSGTAAAPVAKPTDGLVDSTSGATTQTDDCDAPGTVLGEPYKEAQSLGVSLDTEAQNGTTPTFPEESSCKLAFPIYYTQTCRSDKKWETSAILKVRKKGVDTKIATFDSEQGPLSSTYKNIFAQAVSKAEEYCKQELEIKTCTYRRNGDGRLIELEGVEKIKCLGKMDKADMKEAGLDKDKVGDLVEEAAEDVEDEIKELLKSEDEVDYSKGEELNEDLQDAVDSVKRVTGSEKKVNQISRRLAAYKKTGEQVRKTRERSEFISNQLDVIENQYDDMINYAEQMKYAMDNGVPGAQFQYEQAMMRANNLFMQTQVMKPQIDGLRFPFETLNLFYGGDKGIMRSGEVMDFFKATPYTDLATRYNEYSTGLGNLLGANMDNTLIDASSFDSLSYQNGLASTGSLRAGLGTNSRFALRGIGANYDSARPFMYDRQPSVRLNNLSGNSFGNRSTNFNIPINQFGNDPFSRSPSLFRQNGNGLLNRGVNNGGVLFRQ